MQKTKFSKNHEEDNIKVQKKNNTVLSNYTYLISDVILKTHKKKTINHYENYFVYS